MEITIREIDEHTLHDVNKCDAAFTVISKLILHAENGIISYSVMGVEPYQKRYEFEEKDYSSYIADQNKVMYFAYVEGQLAGQIEISKHWNGFAWIDDIAVDAEFRRHGVGSALMQASVNWAKARLLPGIMLETQNNNVAACRFYENFGFQLYGFDTHLYKGLHSSTDEIALYWYLIFENPSS